MARIHPLGLAYRGASPELLQLATDAALLCSHNYPEGLDAARVQAAAVGWLACRQAGQPGCSPGALLDHLSSLAQSERLRKSLKLMRLWVSVTHSAGTPCAPFPTRQLTLHAAPSSAAPTPWQCNPPSAIPAW